MAANHLPRVIGGRARADYLVITLKALFDGLGLPAGIWRPIVWGDVLHPVPMAVRDPALATVGDALRVEEATGAFRIGDPGEWVERARDVVLAVRDILPVIDALALGGHLLLPWRPEPVESDDGSLTVLPDMGWDEDDMELLSFPLAELCAIVEDMRVYAFWKMLTNFHEEATWDEESMPACLGGYVPYVWTDPLTGVTHGDYARVWRAGRDA